MYLSVLCALAAVVAAIAMVAGDRAKVVGDTPEARVASVSRIASAAPPGAGQALAGAATEDPDAGVRQAAMAGLAQFVRPEFRPSVESGLKDGSPKVRAAAAGTLSLYRDEKAANALDELAKADADRQVRRAALTGLGQCPGPRAIVTLLETAERETDPELRVYAMRALAAKLGARIDLEMSPRNDAAWRKLVQRLKRMNAIENAYNSLGTKLVHHPEDEERGHTEPRQASGTPTGQPGR